MRFFPLWLVEIETIPSPMWALGISAYSSAVILSQTQVVSSHMCTDKSSASGWGDILQVSRSLCAAPPLLVFCPTNHMPPWTPQTLSFPTQSVGVPLGWGWVPLLCCGLETTPTQYAAVTGVLSFFSVVILLCCTLTSAWEPLSHGFCSVFWLFDVHGAWEPGFSNSVLVGSRIQPPHFFPPILFFSYWKNDS